MSNANHRGWQIVCGISTCGLPAMIERRGPYGRSAGDAAMNQVRRTRVCEAGHRTLTFEVEAAEIADLRRRAHLYEMTVGSATEVAP